MNDLRDDTLGFDIAEDEWTMVDPQRLTEAKRMAERGEAATTVWGDEMTYGMYSMNREGLLWRLAYVGGLKEVPEKMICEIATWSDDALRAWLTRWAIETRANLDAGDLRPAHVPERGGN